MRTKRKSYTASIEEQTLTASITRGSWRLAAFSIIPYKQFQFSSETVLVSAHWQYCHIINMAYKRTWANNKQRLTVPKQPFYWSKLCRLLAQLYVETIISIAMIHKIYVDNNSSVNIYNIPLFISCQILIMPNLSIYKSHRFKQFLCCLSDCSTSGYNYMSVNRCLPASTTWPPWMWHKSNVAGAMLLDVDNEKGQKNFCQFHSPWIIRNRISWCPQKESKHIPYGCP